MNPPTWDDLYISGQTIWEFPHPLVQKRIEFMVTNQTEMQNVLDLGCGFGGHLEPLAHYWSHVGGLDWSLEGILLADQAFLHRSGDNISLVLGDMIHLPFADSCFDSLHSIHFIYNNPIDLFRQTIDEVHRVLRSGGVAAITFQSDRSWRNGTGLALEPNTFIPDVGLDAGIPHHYFDMIELAVELRKFTIWSLEQEESISADGNRSSHWQVNLEKS